LRQVTPRLAGVILAREEAVLEVVPGLRGNAMPAPFLVVLTPFLADETAADFLAGEGFFRAAVFRAGAFFGTAVAPSALQASRIIAAMAAQLKIFLMDSIASLTIP
jgi:hypothetical protein